MSISDLALMPVLGLPLVAVLGILLFLCICTTASIAALRKRQKIQIPFTWHYRFAGLSILLSVVHGILGLSIYAGF